VRKLSAPLLFLAGLAIVAAVAAATFGVVVALGLDDDADDAVAGGSDDPVVDPGDAGGDGTALLANQVRLTGTATGVTVEGATVERIDTPLIVTGGDGRGATLTDVEIDGVRTDIVWDGGRDLDLRAGGLAILPSRLNIFAAPAAVTLGFPDDVVHALAPGVYGLQTPVALGSGGLAQAEDAVAFAATPETAIAFRGGATTSILPRELTFEAAGRVVVEGTLRVEQPTGTPADATKVELPDGQYRLTITPLADGSGYEIEALLQGDVELT
jgi:hypothetical protein